jgi:hypothetical protein
MRGRKVTGLRWQIRGEALRVPVGALSLAILSIVDKPADIYHSFN